MIILTGLKVGREFKNLKELCLTINVEYKDSTNSRIKAKKEIERYMKLDTKGRKVIIAEIYKEALEKIDGRKENGHAEGSRNNNNPYGKYIDVILKEYIITTEKTKFYTTTNILAKEFGLINLNYSVASSNKRKYFQYSYREVNGEANKTAMWDTFGIIKGVLKGAVRSSLDRIATTGIITYKEAYIVIFNNNTRIATAKETKIIKKCESEILELLDTTKQKMQFNDRLRNQYYIAVEKLACQRLDNYNKHFVGYEIKILKNIKSETSAIEIKILKENVNRVFKERINKSLDKIRNKTKIDVKIGSPKWVGTANPSWDIWIKNRINITYLYYSKYILDSLIGLNYKNITEDIENTKVTEYIPKGESIDFSKLNKIDILDIYNKADEETKEIIALYHMDTNDIPY